MLSLNNLKSTGFITFNFLKRGPKKYWLLLILAGFTACKIAQPERISFVVPPTTSVKSWVRIFAQPKDITVTTIETGKIEVKISDVLNLKNINAKGMKDSSLYVPVFIHLIHHPVYGDWLVDSGLDSSFYKDPHGNIKGLLRGLFICTQEKGQDVTSQLASRGITIKGVFFTHLHPDHVTGVPGLPKNIEYVCGKGETVTIIRPLGIKLFSSEQLSGIAKMEEFDFSKAEPIAPVGPAIDVFGDGSFWAISTPGHTIAHTSYVVNTSSGPVLLTGDVSHTRTGWNKEIEPGGFTLNRPQNLKSLLQLKEFVKQYPQLKVVLGHQL